MIFKIQSFLRAVAKDSRIKGQDLRVINILIGYIGFDTHQCWPSLNTISKELDIPKPHVSDSLKKFADLGYIHTVRLKNRNQYTFLFPENEEKPLIVPTRDKSKGLPLEVTVAEKLLPSEVTKGYPRRELGVTPGGNLTLYNNLDKELTEKGFSNLNSEGEEEIPELIKPLIEILLKKLGRVGYDSLFGDVHWTLNGIKPTIHAPSQFRMNRIEDKLLAFLCDSAKEVGLGLPNFEVLNGKKTLSS
jgi:hypothetical protein